MNNTKTEHFHPVTVTTEQPVTHYICSGVDPQYDPIELLINQTLRHESNVKAKLEKAHSTTSETTHKSSEMGYSGIVGSFHVPRTLPKAEFHGVDGTIQYPLFGAMAHFVDRNTPHANQLVA